MWDSAVGAVPSVSKGGFYGEVLGGICMRHVSMGEVTEMWVWVHSSMTVGDIGAGRTNK